MLVADAVKEIDVISKAIGEIDLALQKASEDLSKVVINKNNLVEGVASVNTWISNTKKNSVVSLPDMRVAIKQEGALQKQLNETNALIAVIQSRMAEGQRQRKLLIDKLEALSVAASKDNMIQFRRS